MTTFICAMPKKPKSRCRNIYRGVSGLVRGISLPVGVGSGEGAVHPPQKILFEIFA